MQTGCPYLFHLQKKKQLQVDISCYMHFTSYSLFCFVHLSFYALPLFEDFGAVPSVIPQCTKINHQGQFQYINLLFMIMISKSCRCIMLNHWDMCSLPFNVSPICLSACPQLLYTSHQLNPLLLSDHLWLYSVQLCITLLLLACYSCLNAHDDLDLNDLETCHMSYALAWSYLVSMMIMMTKILRSWRSRNQQNGYENRSG